MLAVLLGVADMLLVVGTLLAADMLLVADALLELDSVALGLGCMDMLVWFGCCSLFD
jgi:hypothetical protein